MTPTTIRKLCEDVLRRHDENCCGYTAPNGDPCHAEALLASALLAALKMRKHFEKHALAEPSGYKALAAFDTALERLGGA